MHIIVPAIEFAHFNYDLLTSCSATCIIETQIGNYLKCLLLLGEQLKQDRVQMFVATRYATNQKVEFKCLRLHSEKSGAFLFNEVVVEKFKGYYKSKIARYGKCDTIAFGKVLGFEKAFLIQNMCPITEKYIKNEYIDGRAAIPVKIDGRFESELISKAKRVLALERKGIKLIFPDVLKIERELLAP